MKLGPVRKGVALVSGATLGAIGGMLLASGRVNRSTAPAKVRALAVGSAAGGGLVGLVIAAAAVAAAGGDEQTT